MKKLLLVLSIFLIISSSAFAFNITIDGDTKEYTGPNVKLVLNNEAFILEENQMPPIIIEGRTLVPVREIFETLGGKIDWDNETKKVTVWMDENTIELEINSQLAGVNGVAKDLDVPAKIINNKTMVPVRFILENCGLVVNWDNETKTVSIENPNAIPVEEISGDDIAEKEIIDIETSGEEHIIIPEDLPFNIKTFNEKFSKSFGNRKSINSTYQLCETIARNNMLNEANHITVEFNDGVSEPTISDDFIVITEIKVGILKSNNTRYDVSGEYGEDGYLNKVIIKLVK